MDKIKALYIAVVSTLMSLLGILAVPVLLLVSCNIIDYITGIMASNYRGEKLSSYKGIKGIAKKVCQWLLIIVGSMIDTLINYALSTTSIDIKLPFIVAVVVAVWLVINEIISILENIIDIAGEEAMPPFLMPLVKMIKKKTEDVTESKKEDDKDEDSN